VLQPERVVDARDVYGGTAANRVRDAVERAERRLSETREWVEAHLARCETE